MNHNVEWTIAYSRMAQADFRTWNDLQGQPECHKRLFLQMACEKLVKANLCDSGIDPNLLRARPVARVRLRRLACRVGVNDRLGNLRR